VLRGINFITRKPFIIVYNVFEGEEIEKLSESDYIISNLKLQEETKHLNFEEQLEFLKLYGFEPINEILINKIKEKLDIILFFTAGEKEVRSWILKNGKTIKEAAGKIHSDLEKGFVRAEVIHFEEFMKIKDLKLAKEKGLIRVEGKDYIVKDGDIVYIRASI
jgi:ribosome-binding ATPase YchF (GTP1/OBG family)